MMGEFTLTMGSLVLLLSILYCSKEISLLFVKLDYRELGKKMLKDLNELRDEYPERYLVQVCGPISTGGRGNIDENLKFLRAAVKTVNAQEYLLRDEPFGTQTNQTRRYCIVFDQTPYEDEIYQIKKNRKLAGLWKDYDELILIGCYGPLFDSGLFDTFIFLPEYISSFGCRWEMEKGESLDIPCLLWNQIAFRL